MSEEKVRVKQRSEGRTCNLWDKSDANRPYQSHDLVDSINKKAVSLMNRLMTPELLHSLGDN